MPIVINEIIIKSSVEPIPNTNNTNNQVQEAAQVEEIVKLAVQKVLQIMEEKKQR